MGFGCDCLTLPTQIDSIAQVNCRDQWLRMKTSSSANSKKARVFEQRYVSVFSKASISFRRNRRAFPNRIGVNALEGQHKWHADARSNS